MKFKVGDKVRYCKNIEDPYNECAIPLGTEGTIVEILGYENCNLSVEYEVKRYETNNFDEDELELV